MAKPAWLPVGTTPYHATCITQTLGVASGVRESLNKNNEYGYADSFNFSWLYIFEISDDHTYFLTLFLTKISAKLPSLFSPFARIRLRPVIVGSTIMRMGVLTESSLATILHG